MTQVTAESRREVPGGQRPQVASAAAAAPSAQTKEAAGVRGPAVLCDLIQAQAWSLVSGALAVSRRPRRADRLLPASAARGTAYRMAVHKHVDDLCATELSLCARGGNAGDSAAGPRPSQRLYLGERQPHLVHAEENGVVHMPRRNTR